MVGGNGESKYLNTTRVRKRVQVHSSASAAAAAASLKRAKMTVLLPDVHREEYRKCFKEAYPDCKSVSTVAKEDGEKWKSLTEEGKKFYVDRAAELKAEYGKALESINDDAENDDQNGSSEKEAKEETLDDDDQ